MNRKLVACLAAAACLSLASCNNSPKKLNNIKEKKTINVYSTGDLVNIYALLSEKSFNLADLRFYTEEGQVLTGDQLQWSGTSSVAHISDGKVIYDAMGRASFKGSYYAYTFNLNVSVNKVEANRYLYQVLDMNSAKNSFVLQEGNFNNVNYDTANNALELNALYSGGTVRVDYPIEEGFNYNYTIEADFEFLQATENSRYAGIMFRVNPDNSSLWYQMDVRKNIQSDSGGQAGIECTERNVGGYVYPQRSFYHEALPTDRPVKLKVVVEGMSAQFYIDNNQVINTTLNNVTAGNIGFQVNNGNARFSNIRIETGNATLIHTADGSASYSNKTNHYESFPVLSPNYASAQDLAGTMLNSKILSFSFKVEEENDVLLAKTFDGQKLANLYDLLIGYRARLIPNVLIENKATAKKVADLAAAIGFDDMTIMSKDVEVLKEYRKYNRMNRLAFISSATAIETYQQASVECFKAGEAGANIVVLDANIITKDAVFFIASRGYGAWAINMDPANKLAPYKATIAGANVFIATSQEEALKALDENIFDTTYALFRKPVITGHRGDGSNIYLPENSLESLIWAYNNGANAVEIDIHTTADNDLIIIHNGTTNATSNCSLTVANSTVAQLKKCKLKQNDQVTDYTYPTLREAFEKFKDKNLLFVIEIKDNRMGTAKKMMEMAKEYDMMNRILAIDFSTASLDYIKLNEPGIHVGFLGGVNMKNTVQYASADRTYFNKGIGLSPNMGYMDQEGFDASNARGNHYWVWTFNAGESGTFMKFMKYNNTAFTTNRVDLTSNWKIRFDSAEKSYSINNGGSITLQGQATSYMGDVTPETTFTVKVIEGEEFITIANRSIVGKKSGTAYVVLEYNVTYSMQGNSATYRLYSDIIPITVN